MIWLHWDCDIVYNGILLLHGRKLAQANYKSFNMSETNTTNFVLLTQEAGTNAE